MNKNRLKEERIAHKLTQKQVAERLNVSTSTYQKYENYERGVPEEIYKKLAKLYNTSVDYLMGM